jgi:hypothetical protein
VRHVTQSNISTTVRDVVGMAHDLVQEEAPDEDEEIDQLDHDDEIASDRHRGGIERTRPSILPRAVAAVTTPQPTQPRAAALIPVGRDSPPRVELSWSTLGTDSLNSSIPNLALPPPSNNGVGRSISEVAVSVIEGAEDVDQEDEDEDEEYLDAEEEPANPETHLHQPPPLPLPPFRDRLDSALEALRSPSSPLVPGLIPGESITSVVTTINNNDNGEGGTATVAADNEVAQSSTSASSFTSSTSSNEIESTSGNVATRMTAIVGGTTPASSRLGLPPTLPPILTEHDDVDQGEGRTWSRGAQTSSSSSSLHDYVYPLPPQNRSQTPNYSSSHHVPRSLAQERRSTHLQRLGEVPLPSPSLSGFYDWLENASVNASVAAASVGAPTGERVEDTDQSQESNDGARQRASWEEDVLSGLIYMLLPRLFGDG